MHPALILPGFTDAAIKKPPDSMNIVYQCMDGFIYLRGSSRPSYRASYHIYGHWAWVNAFELEPKETQEDNVFFSRLLRERYPAHPYFKALRQRKEIERTLCDGTLSPDLLDLVVSLLKQEGTP